MRSCKPSIPCKTFVEKSKLVQSWGEFLQDNLPLEKIAENYENALNLLMEVKFDLKFLIIQIYDSLLPILV